MNDYASIREIVSPIAIRHGVPRVFLFGSRARGDNRPDSDYDFLIAKGKVTTLWKLAALWDDLEGALRHPVDIITEGSPDQRLLEQARKDAVLIYEQS